MPITESVRSGRRAGFFQTENGLIDHYARKMQPTDVAVYMALERFANCHTRFTFVGTARIAEVLNISQRGVQRSIKVLETLKLIRIVQTATSRNYYVLPVPAQAKAATTPLFDSLPEDELAYDAAVVEATLQSSFTPPASASAPGGSRRAPAASPAGDNPDAVYKEEQDSVNNTQQQDFFNKQHDNEIPGIHQTARRLLNVLGLTESSMEPALAAVQERMDRTRLSMDGIIQDLATAANTAGRRGIDAERFLNDFLARQAAERIVEELHLPATNSLNATVSAAVAAESRGSGISPRRVVELIVTAAQDDSRRGVAIDRFYFENMKWRNHGNSGKGQQQFDRIKAARDRAHQIIEERFRSVDH